MNLLDVFADLPDPRLDRQKKHKLIDIVALTICGVLAGEDNFADIEFYARNKFDFFKGFLELPNGIPSHDTFSRVWGLINPKHFEKRFQCWLDALKLELSLSTQVVAIDGKTMRGSAQKSKNKSGLHVVTAYATELGLALGQVATKEKSNEITAIPELLESLYLKGCIVTIDAMGCQKEIAKKIIAQGAHAILAVKNNQPSLHEDIAVYLKSEKEKPGGLDRHEAVDKGHGRVEIRTCYVSQDLDWLIDRHPGWPPFQSIIMMESERHLGEKIERSTRYYISSMPCSAEAAQTYIRSHWAVENNLHYVLDVVFNEDAHQLINKSAAANLNVIRKMVMGLLKNLKSDRKFPSLKAKRKLCGWDDSFLLEVLGFVKDN